MQSTTIKDFIANHFIVDDHPVILPIKMTGTVPVGTKNNLSLEELKEVLDQGEVLKNGKQFKPIKMAEATHYEMRLRYADVVCLDVDGIKENGDISKEQFFEANIHEFFNNLPYTLSRKKQLPHFFMKISGFDIKTLKNSYIDCFKDFKGDLLFNHVWEKVDAEVFNYNEDIPTVEWDQIASLLNTDFHAKHTEEVEVEDVGDISHLVGLTEIEKLLECIGSKRCDTGSYDTWIAVGQAIKNEMKEDGNKYFIKWTNKYGSENKKDEVYDKITKYIKHTPKKDKNRLSIASMHFWAKQDNQSLYNALFNKTIEIVDLTEEQKKNFKLVDAILEITTESNIANLLNTLNEGKHKCVSIKDNVFYSYENGLWKQNESGVILRKLITSQLGDLFKEYLDHTTKQLETLNDADPAYDTYRKKMNKLSELVVWIGKTGWKNNIMREITDIVYDANFVEKLNRKKDYLPVSNGVLNMDTFQLEDRQIDDYFTYECDANFIPYDKDAEGFQFVEKYFNDLFSNNTETQKCFIDILKSCLSGRTLRYIYFLTGSGCNGKSLLLKILAGIFGASVDTISKLVVIKQKGNHSGVITSELEKLVNCRLGVVSELTSADELNETRIKEITGGDKIDHRGLFKGNKTIIPTANMMCATNELPKFKVEKAILKRLIIVPFKNTFEINAAFEDKLMYYKDYIFSYIMCKGTISDKFELSDEMKLSTSEYAADNSDPLQEFITTMLKPCVNGRTTKKAILISDFREQYNLWCKRMSYGLDSRGKAAFTKALNAFGVLAKESHSVVRVYGVEIVEPDEDATEEEDEEKAIDDYLGI